MYSFKYYDIVLRFFFLRFFFSVVDVFHEVLQFYTDFGLFHEIPLFCGRRLQNFDTVFGLFHQILLSLFSMKCSDTAFCLFLEVLLFCGRPFPCSALILFFGIFGSSELHR